MIIVGELTYPKISCWWQLLEASLIFEICISTVILFSESFFLTSKIMTGFVLLD
jgi:hypothetical protein